MERTDTELYWAALNRAPHHGESAEVSALRDFVHAEMLAGRIDATTTDRMGELVDAVSATQRPRVGDLIGPNATTIAWDVLEVVDIEGDTWRRAFGDDGRTEDGDEYEWAAAGGGGHSTTEGLLYYTPLRVTRVAMRPDADIPS